MPRIRVMHYINQFFAGIGGEAKADVPFAWFQGPVGPGKRLQELLGDSAEIVVTTYCGDDYFSQHLDQTVAAILRTAREHNIQLLVAGPAFASGRYGFACAEVCHAVSSTLGLHSVTGLHLENPGVETYQQHKDRLVYAFPTAKEAIGMGAALSTMARFICKLAAQAAIGTPAEEGYIPRGFRLDKTKSASGAARGVRLLLDKIAGRPFVSEIPVENIESIPVSPPIADLKKACLALVTTGGVIPPGNPDGFRGFQNVRWGKYSIDSLNCMLDADWDVLHGGYNTDSMKRNPNYGVPLDICREMEREGVFRKLHSHFYGTPGARGLLSVMHQVGNDMASDMKSNGVEGALLVST
jgi:glycine reductase complex component B subunit gamma